jgi:hypothetical protein
VSRVDPYEVKIPLETNADPDLRDDFDVPKLARRSRPGGNEREMGNVLLQKK